MVECCGRMNDTGAAELLGKTPRMRDDCEVVLVSQTLVNMCQLSLLHTVKLEKSHRIYNMGKVRPFLGIVRVIVRVIVQLFEYGATILIELEIVQCATWYRSVKDLCPI